MFGWQILVLCLAAGIVSAVHLALAGAPVSLQPALHVMPFPGTPDASPSSEIIFSSLTRSDLISVAVRGSKSGMHGGRLAALPAHAGTSFTPTRSFAPGEQVDVMAVLSSPQAGTESGDPGSTKLRFSFTVATPAPRGAVLAIRRYARGGPSLPVARFHSMPGLRPPLVRAGRDPDRRAGDVFLTAQIGSVWAGKGVQGGPMILDSRGRLVWFRPVGHLTATNLAEQRYRGQPVLTWWQGDLASDSGREIVLNRSYRTVATVRGAEGYRLDLHEFQVTPEGTALVDAYEPVEEHLTSAAGARTRVVMDCVIQEIDIRTGKLLWEWHTLGHIPVSDSYIPAPNRTVAYDFFHLNSLQQLPDHRLLISARGTWAVYEIDQLTGRVIWRLGGRRSSFRIGRRARFEWQHDARLVGNRLTVFDDAGVPQEEPQSSAELLRIDTARMTASLIARYHHSPPLLSAGAGNMQVLPGGSVFVGWGSQPSFSEYAPDGRQIFSANLPFGAASYRAYRFRWTGQPTATPALAATSSHRAITVYASWNGATQVASWRVLGGPRAGQLRVLTGRRRSGFETALKIHSGPRYVAVEALNASARVLGTSRTKAVKG
jgi:hypothetical protein